MISAKVGRWVAAMVAAVAGMWGYPAAATAATTFTVTGTGDPAGATCAGTVCQSLRAAVAAADGSPGSIVRLGATTYTLSQSALPVAPANGSVTIVGAGASAQGTTIVQTHAGSRVVKVSGTEPVMISGLQLTGGSLAGKVGHSGQAGGDADGGGIFNASAPLTLVHVAVTGNTATGGTGGTGNNAAPFGGSGGEAVGGIYSDGRLTLIDSLVSSNVAKAGGGGAGAPVNVMGNGGFGGYAVGGIFVHAPTGPTLISGSTISGNNATGGIAGTKGGGSLGGDGGNAAGGVAGDAQSLTLSNANVASNSATGGAGITTDTNSSGGSAYGGIWLSTPTGTALSVIGSTFSANSARGGAGGSGGFAYGGAITVSGMTGAVSSSTIVANHSTAGSSHGGQVPGIGGGGVFIEGGATLTLTGTMIAQNAVTGGASSIGSGGSACGGGIINEGTATLVGDTISGNTAAGGPRPAGGLGGTGDGAGMCLYAFGTTVVNSTITGNLALGGGGGNSGGGHAGGGGVEMQAGPATLESDTIFGNGASAGPGGSAAGGNLLLVPNGIGVKLTIADTIVADGTVVGGTVNSSNCEVTAPQVVDQAHNLESTTPSECGLGAGDLVGADPQLETLAANGGPTQTMALAAGSPAIGAGGVCRDPTKSGSPPLSTDQRGLPRHAPCDIGAFQSQKPADTAAPAIFGPKAPGRVLTCSRGKWTGDPTLTYTYTWARRGAVIPGAKSATYKVAHADIGARLTCAVTATNKYGHATATSPAVSIPPRPTITHLSQSHKTWRKSTKTARLSGAGHSKKHPVGTSFTFRLNTPASVILTFRHTLHGRRSGGKCVRKSKRNQGHRACTLSVTDGALLFRNATAGVNMVSFGGKLSSHRSLSLGSHTVTIAATNVSGHTTSRALQFTIVRR